MAAVLHWTYLEYIYMNENDCIVIQNYSLNIVSNGRNGTEQGPDSI